ncbi:MAG: hypothetical protein A2931_03960 [Candidatus Niyogibacteria bacterium RIFCSPLOWO2_01_FULL_45_48]|uniref:Uncharacterized protein n=2 Tax=Candidatus Niyogiibacteriota TaxID=1817912 RepID=A0A1G2EZ99_9BACT|nr:MAG: hypothetical protein A2931_03960 [Candidatus Niyogibacteria bacterium RIFCSPLOWO2_01_FULL_45_48]OGZ30420.1 MAG: hypothetical protein A2835_01275 [Candidatus Niyogibacteria bacterium RIFCSPHIGHO2_01_FULL_45_28]OGZ31154.1 MAG: hypothetical protein A3J00_01225 [Candidatus Niyogibacteria bacterium RIFCSPLOWO2_02_FULL_45_13]
MNKWQMFSRRESDHTVVQGDITLLISFIPLLVLFLFMVFLNDPTTKDPDKNPFEAVVEWDGLSLVDIDTWTWCTNPATGLWEIVSYQNRKGKFIFLDQDDRGYKSDKPLDNANKETIKSLGNRLPAALCGLNLHVFGTNGGTLPVEITVSAVLFKGHETGKQVVLLDQKKVAMSRAGEEVTVTSFEIDSEGKFVVGSNKMTVQMRCASSFGRNCTPD